jgi:hypothetical protein
MPFAGSQWHHAHKVPSNITNNALGLGQFTKMPMIAAKIGCFSGMRKCVDGD